MKLMKYFKELWKAKIELVQDIAGMIDIHYIRQKEPKGSGHAIHCAKSFMGNQSFAILLLIFFQ